MGIRNKLTKRANELSEGYQEARDEEFDKEFRACFKAYFAENQTDNIIDANDIQDFLTTFDENYPDETNWSWDAANAELDEVGDQQMELARDKEMDL